MADQFREAEVTFDLLRKNFWDRKISQQEFADSLKKLRIKDAEGRFWVIGAQSGKWYAFENGDWVEAKPPSQMERRAICIFCGFENDLEAEVCARCGSRHDDSVPEPVGPAQKTIPAALSDTAPRPLGREAVVRSLDIVSFLLFFGVLGIFAGILFGLLAGVTDLFKGFVDRLPGFFTDHHRDLLGGLAFSIVGGVLGFAAGAAAGAVTAVVSNGVLSLVGGLKFRRS
jgi:hypothetical protein